jgi:hypothetical protein
MNRDFEEFFALLNAKSIEFLVVGGVAYNFHAPPRATKDIDVWVRPERSNLERLAAAISEFGFPSGDVDIDDLATKERVVMLGTVPNRIDLLTRPAGLHWESAWAKRVAGHYGRTPIWVLSLEDLIAAKTAAGRPRDLADASVLEEIARRGDARGVE